MRPLTAKQKAHLKKMKTEMTAERAARPNLDEKELSRVLAINEAFSYGLELTKAYTDLAGPNTPLGKRGRQILQIHKAWQADVSGLEGRVKAAAAPALAETPTP